MMSGTALSDAVYDALGVADQGADVVGALESVVAAPDPVTRGAAVANLAAELQRGAAPGQLALRVLEKVSVITAHRHQEAPGWRLGSYLLRATLVRELLALAKQSIGPQRQMFAQAALILPAQEDFLFGGPTLSLVLRDPDFPTMSGWSGTGLDQVRQIVRDHLARTEAFLVHHGEVGDLLERQIALPAMEPATVSAILLKLDAMVPITVQRPDLYWRIANYASGVVNLSRAKAQKALVTSVRAAALGWQAALPDPLFHRWVDEVFAIPGKPLASMHFKRMDSASVQRSLKRVL